MQSRMTKRILAAILSVSLLFQINLPVAYGESMVTDKTMETETRETRIATGFVDLADDVKNAILPLGSLEEEISLPEMLTARVEYTFYKKENGQEIGNKAEDNLDIEVSWASDKEFSSSSEGEFTYTAKLIDENYILAEGVEMPRVIVRIEDSGKVLNKAVAMMNIDNTVYASRGTTPTDISCDVNKGNITIENGTAGTLKVTHGSDTVEDNIAKDTMITLTGATTTNTVKVYAGVEAIIGLSGVDIKAPTGESAFEIVGDASNIDIKLLGENNSLIGASDWAGVHMEGESTLTIGGKGKLTVAGGEYGSGIGGGREGSLKGSVIIADGQVTVKGGDYGSGIGGGAYAGSLSGAVKITGGTVTTTGGKNSSGIGGGGRGSINEGGKVEITGGTVIAKGGEYGSGIGGGGNKGQLAGTVKIGGTAAVEATGGTRAPGIGGGEKGKLSGEVNIIEGTVTAKGGSLSSGIGGGYEGLLSGVVKIAGGSVTVIGGNQGSGIGGGNKGSLTGAVKITGGSLTVTGGAHGAGIGGGYEGSINKEGVVEITKGTVIATGGTRASGIGGGNNGSLTGAVRITGGSLTATGGAHGSGIGGGGRGSINEEGKVEIIGGTVISKGGEHGSGIGGGREGSLKGSVIIADGQVTVKGGEYGSGIGGGREGSLKGSVIINDGQVTVKGGDYGSGIGGGAYAGSLSGVVKITGGKVTATGGINSSGIGGGGRGSINEEGKVEITGGTVISKGGEYGSGIGGGGNKGLLAGIVKIGGTAEVEATGGTRAPGIGGGEKGELSGEVNIIEGTVTARGGSLSSGIGGGYEGLLSGVVKIAGGSVTVIGGNQGSGIGGGNKGSLTGAVKITGGSLTVTGGAHGAGIGGGYEGSLNGVVEITKGTVTATGGTRASGIGGGNNGSLTGTVKIDDGQVTVKGGDYGSGIGAGNEGSLTGAVKITDGSVTATGGQYGSGMGAGFKGSIIGKIEISSGTVTAMGGSQGSGIGGGSESIIDEKSIIKITKGTVVATGGVHGAGIGGGYDGSVKGTIEITEGRVTATGGKYGSGIGGGNKGSLTGPINIEGDTVDVTDIKVSVNEGITKTSFYGGQIYRPDDDSIITGGAVSYYQINGDSIESPVEVGTYKVETTSGNRSITRKFKIKENLLKNITIKTKATKLVYRVGETIDITGLVIEGTYADGNKKLEEITVENITGFDSSQAVASQELIVTVNQKTTSYTVEIQAIPVVRYKVTFKDYDGKEFKIEEVEEGESASPPSNPIRRGYTFIGWDKKFDNIVADTIVIANYRKNRSANDKGTSSSGKISKIEIRKEEDGQTKAIASISPTVTKYTANVQLNKNIFKDAIEKAQAAVKKEATEEDDISIEIKVDTKNIVTSTLSANIGKSTIEDLTRAEVKNLTINSDMALISLDLETLKTIQAEIKTDINFSTKRVERSTLSHEVQKIVKSRPVFDFSITGTNGEKLSRFGKGKISISIPYTLAEGEKEDNLVIYYINDQGKVEEIPNSIYDKASGIISFETDHFSKFAVGHKEDEITTKFTDIENHWAKEDIEFVTAIKLFSGTDDKIFSPNMHMTRGMFVTVLGRLAQIDIKNYKGSSFKDLKSDAYYMPYTQWASKMGIVKGIGENKFAPEKNINREQMAVIMVNYSKSRGLELPQIKERRIFKDCDKISHYSRVSVEQMQMSNIISGKNNNKFDPKGPATRAEVSAVLKRFVTIVKTED